jgi:hypothetical protein
MDDNCLCCKHLRLKEKTIPAASQPPFLGLLAQNAGFLRNRVFVKCTGTNQETQPPKHVGGTTPVR